MQSQEGGIDSRITECGKQLTELRTEILELRKRIDDCCSHLTPSPLPEVARSAVECGSAVGCASADAHPIDLAPYRGADDPRSPFDFLDEFENRFALNEPTQQRASSFRRILWSSEHTNWVRQTYDVTEYHQLKIEFLKRHWNQQARDALIDDYLSYDFRIRRPVAFCDYLRTWKCKLTAAFVLSPIVDVQPRLVKCFESRAPGSVKAAIKEGSPQTLQELENIILQVPYETICYDQKELLLMPPISGYDLEHLRSVAQRAVNLEIQS